MIKRLFCRHKDTRVTHWVWTHGPGGYEPRYIEARLKCNKCDKEKYISIKDPDKFNEFTEANPFQNLMYWHEQMIETKNRILDLKSFMGGDNEDTPINEDSIEHMITIVELCYAYAVYQPEIFPWAGGDGIQAQWEYDWYFEINSSSKGISVLIVKDDGYSESISCDFEDIVSAFFLIKLFVNKIADTSKTRNIKRKE